jgi:hypothetical protein
VLPFFCLFGTQTYRSESQETGKKWERILTKIRARMRKRKEGGREDESLE